MLRIIHFIIVALYLLAPIAVIGWILLQRRRQDRVAARLASLAVTFVAALAIAGSLCVIYARATGGHVPLRQIALATYFAAGLLLILRGFDAGLLWTLRRALRVHQPAPPTLWRGARLFAALMTRALVLIVFGLPFVMAAVMTYRPKVLPNDNPRSQLGFAYERVEFAATDGTKLVGWWMPAEAPLPRRPRPDANWGRRTVIVCHGLASNKSNQLILSRALVPGGFNVLAFDFRAHGESGGQTTSYGVREKHDVLGAVRWLRENRSEQSREIFGVGASMGAVALIAAATDPSWEGQAIEAIASYAAYDDLAALTGDLTSFYFRPSLGWLVERIGLPVAAMHAGADLVDFRPVDSVADFWPRPILFIHGRNDEIIPFERGQSLRDAASQPRYHIWYPVGTHNDIVSDEAAASIVVEFFRKAQPFPVI